MKQGLIAKVKSGQVTIPIYWEETGELYGARWTEGGRHRRRRGKDLGKLKVEVRKIAQRLAGNIPAIESLSDDDLAILREIRRKGVTLADLETLQTVESVTVAEASRRLLEAKADTSTDNQRTLKTHLGQFGRKFGKRVISSITTTEIDAWLKKAAETPRTRRNKRSSLVTLWRWARDKGLLPQALRTVAERTDFPSMRKQKRDLVIETWSPVELRIILKTVPPAYLPWVALSAFAGLRSLELFPGEKDPGNRKQVLHGRILC